MYSPSNKEAILLESSSKIRFFNGSQGSAPRIKEIPSHLYYATFASFAPLMQGRDLVVVGGATAEESGVVLCEETVLLARKHAKPMLCSIVRGEDGVVEVWTWWSDSILAQTNVVAGGELQKSDNKTTLFELSGVSGVNEVRVLKGGGGLPDVTSWRRPSHLIVTGGAGPCLASFHLYAGSKEGAPTGKSLLAVAAATALSSAVSSLARRWLMTPEGGEDEEAEEDSDDELVSQTLAPRIVFEDEGREVNTLACGNVLCAAGDNLGRVILFVPDTLHILRVLKGYRAPQLCFLSFEDRPQVDLLLVLAPLSRGNKMELWRGEGERPFAVMDIPNEFEPLLLASSFDHAKSAIMATSRHPTSTSGTLCALTLDGLSSEELEWDVVLSSMTSPPGDVPLDFLPSMIKRPETVLRHLNHRKGVKGAHVKAFLKAANSASSSSGIQLEERLRRISVMEALHRAVALERHVSDFPETDPIRWSLELYKPEWRPSSWDERVLAVALDTSAAVPLMLDYLLPGDVFLVRDVQKALESVPQERLRDAFTRWALSRPIERSPAWSHPVSSNALVRMAQALEVQPDDFVSRARGRIGLARALCFASRMKWEQPAQELERCLRVSVIVDSDELDVKGVGDSKIVFALAAEAALLAPPETFPGKNSAKPRPWERDGLEALQELLKDSLLSTASARDELRMRVAIKAVRSGAWSLARAALREMEAVERDWGLVQAECLAALPARPPLDPDLARLLMHAFKDIEWKRDAVNALVVAEEVGSVAHYETIRGLLLRSIEPNPNEAELIEKKNASVAELFKAKLASVEQGEAEDEVLKAQGRAMGLHEPAVLLCEWHWSQGRDVRGNESFQAIAQPSDRQIAAAIGMRICRARLAEMLRHARKDRASQEMLASLSPKTVAWILQAEAEALASPPAPLRSTLSVLLCIASELPNDKPPQSAITTSRERCLQMQTILETYLAQHASS